MDKNTLSNYGWIVIAVLVLSVMIALATPFGTYIENGVRSTTQGLLDVNESAFNATGLVEMNNPNISDETTKAHGLYFDKTYIASTGTDIIEAIISEDTTLKLCTNGEWNTIPAGTISYTNTELNLENIGYGIAEISKDGKQFTVNHITFTLKEDGEFAHKNIKYCMGSFQYIIVDDNDNVFLRDLKGNGEGIQIPPQCVEVYENMMIIQNTGVYDGVFIVSDDGNTVYLQAGEEKITVAVKEDFCDHDTIGEGGNKCWYEFLDADNNIVCLRDIHNLSNFKQLTLKCSVCYEEIEFRVYDDSDFIYLYNAAIEPQLSNGEGIHSLADIEFYDANGWVAIPYDITKTNNLYTHIEGEPIVAVLYANNVTLQNSIKYFSLSFGYFDGYGFDVPSDAEITYNGTMEEFKQVKTSPWPWYNHSAIYNIESDIDFGWNDGQNSVTIHCTDGDIVISNY